MVTKEEIDLKCKEFEIHQANVQRDYVFGWLLFGIFSDSALKDVIFLKGGNALRKGYFENTRFSYDLDFGIPDDIDENALMNELNKACEFVGARSGVVFVTDENRIEEKFVASEAPIPGLRVFEVRLYFKDFYGHQDCVKIKISMDITRFDKVLLPIQTVPLIHPYSDRDSAACNIRCMKLEEIIATKLKCMLQRQHAPDLFDYTYSIKLLGGSLNKKEVIETFIQKTIFARNPHVVKNILSSTPFDYFRLYWVKTVVCAKQFILDVEEAIAIFLTDLDNLFSIYPDNGFSTFRYYGPDLRAPIMKAAREQTLLKIIYKDATRMVEPYSLKYLQKRNGEAREYFYVFNVTGGSNPPGIRCLLPENFQSIENTDEKFTPRYPIELSKAGEMPEDRYLFDPNKPAKAPRIGSRIHPTRSGGSGVRYIYECGWCGKKFGRKGRSSTLREHKDKNGNRCGGRTGYYVDTKY